MGNHPRFETSDYGSLQTSRTIASKLWFVNNHKLEQDILGYLARYTTRYEVDLYAFAIEGNHLHHVECFPHKNRASFMRDFNSMVAKAVAREVDSFEGGKLWARRYSSEFLPGDEDIEKYFFYTVLQPVKDGLVPSIGQYPFYNCFHDAIHGIERAFKVIRWADYHSDLRHNPNVRITDYTEIVKLKYKRLPGYEHLSQKEYIKMMNHKLAVHQEAIVKERAEEGLGYLGRDALLKAKPGGIPVHTKTSNMLTHRPRVLCVDPERKEKTLDWYFDMYFRYKEASKRFRAGELSVEFPIGTYRPYTAYAKPEQKPPG